MGGEPLCALAIAGVPPRARPRHLARVFAAARPRRARPASPSSAATRSSTPSRSTASSSAARSGPTRSGATAAGGPATCWSDEGARYRRGGHRPAGRRGRRRTCWRRRVASMTTLNREGAGRCASRRAARRHRRHRVRPRRPPARAGRGIGPGRAAGPARPADPARASSIWPGPATCRADRGATARRPTPTRRFADGHDALLAALACDAQTSGGLLAAVAPGAVARGGDRDRSPGAG